MATLFNDSETFQKERPTKPTEQQVEKFYSDMAKEMITQNFAEDDEETVIKDLKKLYPFNHNGFEMAKDLEHNYRSYNIDTSLCEWLDGLSSDYDAIIRQNIVAWVKAHNPQPKFHKGDKLLITEMRLCFGMTKDMVVYVNGGRPEEAVYWINTDPEKNGGTVLPYELVEEKCKIIRD